MNNYAIEHILKFGNQRPSIYLCIRKPKTIFLP